MSFSLKSVAVAGVILLATVGGAFAAHLNTDTKLLDGPSKWASVIDWVSYGDHVKVYSCGQSYCYVKINGEQGYVKKWAIDFNNGPKNPWPKNPGPFPPYGPYGCVYGPYGYVCI